ncbi:hypothetical protein BYT27DRAFT_6510709 [Phlegmacium glaucopus]|nr:hypothetical protein BYT27DRAFT_6510709 [Phlegmacium glaucopus]
MIGFRTTVNSPSVSNKSSRSNVTTTPASVIGDGAALVPRNVTVSSPLRTLDDVRDQVSQEIAINTITKAEYIDGVRIGVRFLMSSGSDEEFLRQIAGKIRYKMTLRDHLFAVATITQSAKSSPNELIICGSSIEFVQRAMLLTSSKFTGRMVTSAGDEEPDFVWVATISDLGVSPYDEDALWDVMRKSAKSPMDPLAPPPGSKSIDTILSEARSKLQRISASQAFDELRETQVGAPTFLVDIRPAAQRQREGAIHGSLIIERNVLEWRFDPRCASRLAIADRYDLRIIVFCQEGYTSSLAAYSLHQLGLLNATDMIGGYEAWKSAGLPIDLDSRRDSRSLVSRAGSVV